MEKFVEMETKMENIPCDKIIYKFLGKKPIVTQDGELNHLLIYHCLDVAAVGYVFLQENDIYLSKMTQATGLDKKESLSLITFYLTMHDLGKFSNGVQNGDSYSLHFHSKMGFCLWSQIWEKIWIDNLLALDKSVNESIWKDLFEPWFKSVTNRHKKFEDPPQDVMDDFKNDNIVAACCFVKKSAELLLDNNPETQKKYYCGMDVSFNSNSKLLKILTWMSDQIASEYFRYCSRIMPIKEYWDKYAVKRATDAVKDCGKVMSETFEVLPEFSNQDKNIDWISEEVFKRNIAVSKYESELRQELINDYSLSNPAKKVTSDKTINKDKISMDHIDERFDRRLFEILRSLRKEHANGKPHFIVFPDKSLKDMATFRPQDLESFKKIPGIGKKYEIYGESFLEKIVTFCKVQETNTECCYPTKLQKILNLCKQKLTLEEIAQKTNLEVNDIIGYIEELILCGAGIPLDTFVNDTKQKKIKEAIQK